jgi:DNA-binding MarR family transcriptional regulator
LREIDIDELDSRLVKLVHLGSEVLFRLRKLELSPYDITPGASSIITAVQILGEKATSAEIARFTFREPNSVHELLRRMEKKGLLEKTINNGKTRILLTQKGHQIYEELKILKSESLRQIFSFMSEEEEMQLVSGLEEIINRLFQMLGTTRKPPL